MLYALSYGSVTFLGMILYFKSLFLVFARRIVVRAIWADLLWSARFVN